MEGNGPTKLRQPTARKLRCQVHRGSNDKPGRCGSGGFWNPPTPDTGGRIFPDAARSSTSAVKECNTEYPLDARYEFEQCFGPLEERYASREGADPAELRRRIENGPYSIWRYADFLPVEHPYSALGAGWTPLVRADRLARELGIGELWIKNDAANPTHSFKDRVVSVALARAQELGFTTIACASTGNLANAVAAHASAAGLESYVFIPSDLEEQKVLDDEASTGPTWCR